MDPALWGVLGAAGALISGIVAVLALYHTHSEAARKKRSGAVKKAVEEGTSTLAVRVSALETAVTALSGETGKMSAADLATGAQVNDLIRKMDVLETKMEVFWKSVALDAAKVLHSPNPARAHVDALLEALTDGTITESEKAKLRELLTYLRDYHYGDPSDFPIYPSDQVAAVILLRTMEYA